MTKVFTLTAKTERLEKDIEKVQREVDNLTVIVHQQKAQIDVLVYAVQSESDKTRMWVEKEFAKFERRLPSGEKEK